MKKKLTFKKIEIAVLDDRKKADIIGGRVQAGDIRPMPPISFFTRCKCQINYSLHK